MQSVPKNGFATALPDAWALPEHLGGQLREPSALVTAERSAS